jgi:GT2 family glycosyltransferase
VWNDAIRASDAEYICLLNNDTRVEAAWLEQLLECFEDEKVGIAGPITNNCSGSQASTPRTTHKQLNYTRYLVGFCMVFPRSMWEEIGGFDEEFELYGEDTDFCMEALARDYRLCVRTDVFVFHHRAASTGVAENRGKDMVAIRQASKERFHRKWPDFA